MSDENPPITLRRVPQPPPHIPVARPLPGTDELDLLCGRIIAMASRGKTAHAAARALKIPYKTLTSWADQPDGAKLRDAIGQVPDLVRGYFEDEMRRNTSNKNYNTALAGKLLAANYNEYRSISQPVDSNLPEKPPGMDDFEFERRLLSAIDRIRHRRDDDAPAPALPAPEMEND